MMPIEPPDLTGTWALEVVVGTTAHAPLVGDTHSASRSRLAVRITRGPDGFMAHQELCRTELEGGTRLARTILPDGWLRAIPARDYEVELGRDGDGWSFAVDPGVQSVGFDPSAAEVPARASDPSVRDPDADGRPGATVLVEVPGFGTAEVWVAQRGHTRLDGRLVSADRVEGHVTVLEMVQRTIGASNPLFDFTPRIRPDPTRSAFSMWRVPAGGCPAG